MGGMTGEGMNGEGMNGEGMNGEGRGYGQERRERWDGENEEGSRVRMEIESVSRGVVGKER